MKPLSAQPRPRVERTPTAVGRYVAGRHLILSETLFRDALVRERRRADRFEDTFVVALISLDGTHAPTPGWQQLVESLTQLRREDDLVGWFEQGAALGIIRRADASVSAEAAPALAASVHEELLQGLPPDRVEAFSIRLEVYSPQSFALAPVMFDGPRQHSAPREVIRRAAKRTLDVVGSAALLVLSSPLFFGVALLVKLSSPGPVFFRQQRVGRNGRPFQMIKFRTMCVDADPAIHQQYVERFILSGETFAAGGNVISKIVNDPRVTPVGRFLRRSSLDELPQFWNVFIGEMSLVGPRPPLPHEVARYKRWHRRRVLEAKPGMTGLWQVTGRSRTTFDEMVRLDIRYAREQSVWTDLKILLATPWAVLSGKGAH